MRRPPASLASHALLGLGLALALGLAPALLEAHAVLLFPVPRSSLTSKTGPCGGLPRGDEPLVLEAGQDLEVVWDEYVDHPGYYRLLFSMGGDRGFFPLLDGIPDEKPPPGEGTVRYTATVKLPDAPCDACTLQLIQVMTEIPSSPRLYFSCADVRLVPSSQPPAKLRRGDANQDGEIEISDAVSVFIFLFAAGRGPTCPDAADANDDGAIDMSDGIALLAWLFTGGPEPPAPGPSECGADPTPDGLAACEGAAGCAG
ncbi:MAG: hypothetical protein HY721_01370 [Planctomycetes bacterium]|nr:hypothetical protein [Planctomycetota bacterium]